MKQTNQNLVKKQKLADTFPQTGKVRAKQIAAYMGIGESTFWLYVKQGRINAPMKYGARVAVWSAEYIRELAEHGIPEAGGSGMKIKNAPQGGAAQNNINNQYFTTPASTNEMIAAFRGAMIENIGAAPDHVIADGKIHRFSTNGKSHDKSGYYALWLDNIASGFMGDWKTGLKQNWFFRGNQRLSPQEIYKAHQRMRRAKQEAAAERKRLAAKAAELAVRICAEARPARADHPYLVKKAVWPHDLLQQGEQLIIPMQDSSGELANIQRIYPDGKKRFLKDAIKKGCFHIIGNMADDDTRYVWLCEGWATGASLFNAYDGQPVIVAFDAGNLLPVAQVIRAHLPKIPIHLCADNDRKHEPGGNPGVEAANRVRQSVPGVTVHVPQFPDDAPIELSDFNDWVNGGCV